MTMSMAAATSGINAHPSVPGTEQHRWCAAAAAAVTVGGRKYGLCSGSPGRGAREPHRSLQEAFDGFRELRGFLLDFLVAARSEAHSLLFSFEEALEAQPAPEEQQPRRCCCGGPGGEQRQVSGMHVAEQGWFIRELSVSPAALGEPGTCHLACKRCADACCAYTAASSMRSACTLCSCDATRRAFDTWDRSTLVDASNTACIEIENR